MIINRPLRVFLCHSSNDKPAVRELYQKLRAEPWIEPWLDEEELHPGQTWEMEIEKAVENSDVVLICLSNNSINKRGYVQKELRFALDVALEMPEETIFIVPLRFEECIPPRSLRDWQYADYFEGQRERGLQRLLVSLKRRAEALGLKYETPAPEKKEFPGPREGHVIKTPTTNITLSNGMELMRVPAGRFIMGINKYSDEESQYMVDIPYDYWMGRFTVTNEQYNEYCKATNIKHPDLGWEKKKNYPVTYVIWRDAMEYCKWLNDLLKNELPNNLILRLPTEAEWEKAARWRLPSFIGRKVGNEDSGPSEGQALEYPWGNEFDKNKCNSSEGGKKDTTPVGLYSPQGDSPYGCADMAGNVWEWMHSLYKNYPYIVQDGREDETISDRRALRGGSFLNNSEVMRCAGRFGHHSNSFSSLIGFRVAVSLILS